MINWYSYFSYLLIGLSMSNEIEELRNRKGCYNCYIGLNWFYWLNRIHLRFYIPVDIGAVIVNISFFEARKSRGAGPSL